MNRAHVWQLGCYYYNPMSIYSAGSIRPVHLLISCVVTRILSSWWSNFWFSFQICFIITSSFLLKTCAAHFNPYRLLRHYTWWSNRFLTSLFYLVLRTSASFVRPNIFLRILFQKSVGSSLYSCPISISLPRKEELVLPQLYIF